MWNKIKSSYSQYVNKNDLVLLSLISVMLLFGLGFVVINLFTNRFIGNQYIILPWLFLLPFMLVMLGVSWWAKEMAPGLCHFTRFYTLYYLIIMAFAVFIDGAQFTPFPTIDHLLVNIDAAMHVNTPALMAWTASHPVLKLMLGYGYTFVSLQLFFLPAILAAFKDQKVINEYLYMILFIFIVTILIYYFFPTAAPSSVFVSRYFSQDQLATSLKFFQLHHGLVPSTRAGGLVSFPSDHILLALMCLFVTRNYVWLFIPLLIINLFGILATVLLGWHYLIDVIASSVIFCLLAFLIPRLYARFNT